MFKLQFSVLFFLFSSLLNQKPESDYPLTRPWSANSLNSLSGIKSVSKATKTDSPQLRRAAKLSSCRSVLCLLSMLIISLCSPLTVCFYASYCLVFFFYLQTPLSLSACASVRCDASCLPVTRRLSILSLIHLFSASVQGPKTDSNKTTEAKNNWPVDSFSLGDNQQEFATE